MSSPADLDNNSTEEEWAAAVRHRNESRNSSGSRNSNGSRNRSTIASDSSDEFVPIQRANTPERVISNASTMRELIEHDEQAKKSRKKAGIAASHAAAFALNATALKDERETSRNIRAVGRDAAEEGENRMTWRNSWRKGGRRRTKRRGPKTGKKTRRGKRGRKTKKAARKSKRKTRKNKRK